MIDNNSFTDCIHTQMLHGFRFRHKRHNQIEPINYHTSHNFNFLCKLNYTNSAQYEINVSVT